MTSYSETPVGKILLEIQQEYPLIDSEMIEALFYRPSVNGMNPFEFHKALSQLTNKVWLKTLGNYHEKEKTILEDSSICLDAKTYKLIKELKEKFPENKMSIKYLEWGE